MFPRIFILISSLSKVSGSEINIDLHKQQKEIHHFNHININVNDFTINIRMCFLIDKLIL
jgi:hypothetical protein